jgi:transposase
MNVRYRVTLTQYERNGLEALLSGGKSPARKLKRAQILLAADAGVGDEDIAVSIGVGGSTVYRTKRRFVEGNLDLALSEEPRPGAERKLTGKEEALLVATACSSPPAGRARWTLELLADALVKLTAHESLSRETVRRRLAENDLKPWRKDMWCIPQVDADYVARMEDVLDLYAEAPDRQRPVVCFDESPIQLIGEVRQPIPAKPGQIERYDCEYRRNGTANLFVFLDVNRPWRKVKVTGRRAAEDFAACMRDLTDVHYPAAERIRVVLDNLSTHSAGALYHAFPADEGRVGYLGLSGTRRGVVRDVVVKDGERDHQFPVKAGQGDERTVDLPSGRNVTVILEIFAAERGCPVEELVLIRDGEDEPLSGIVLIDAGYPRNRRHHVHHVSAVKVTVSVCRASVLVRSCVNLTSV